MSSSTGPASGRGALLGALFDDADPPVAGPAGDRIADRLADAAWLDWCDVLDHLFDASPSRDDESFRSGGIPATLLQPWCGTLVVHMSWFGESFGLVISGDLIDKFLSKGEAEAGPREASAPIHRAMPITPLLFAAGDEAMAVRVELEPFEIDLGSLSTLHIGDILCTTHALDAGLAVRSTPSATLCRGFLGRQGEQLVVELMRSADAP